MSFIEINKLPISSLQKHICGKNTWIGHVLPQSMFNNELLLSVKKITININLFFFWNRWLFANTELPRNWTWTTRVWRLRVPRRPPKTKPNTWELRFNRTTFTIECGASTTRWAASIQLCKAACHNHTL